MSVSYTCDLKRSWLEYSEPTVTWRNDTLVTVPADDWRWFSARWTWQSRHAVDGKGLILRSMVDDWRRAGVHVYNRIIIIIIIIISSSSCNTGKGKGNVDLYSASLWTPLTRSDMDHTVLPANNVIPAFTCKHSPGGATTHSEHLSSTYYSFIYLKRMNSWVGHVGWHTADSLPRGGHPSTARHGAGQGNRRSNQLCYATNYKWSIFIILLHQYKQECILHNLIYFTYLIAWWRHSCDTWHITTVLSLVHMLKLTVLSLQINFW